jgi:hypothetical protein
VLRLIFAFVDVMLHRRGPDSLPSSRFLLLALFAISLASDFVILTLAGRTARWYAVDLLVFGLNIWFVWALLRTFNKQPRFRQTMTALLGAGVLLAVLQAPLASSVVEPPPDPENPTLTLSRLLWLVIVLWGLDITAFVFARALERPYVLCVAIVIGYALLIESLQATLLQPVA